MKYIALFITLFSFFSFAEDVDSTLLVNIKGKISIKLDPSFVTTQFVSPIVGTRAIINFENGQILENNIQSSVGRPYKSFNKEKSKKDAEELLANGPRCWMVIANHKKENTTSYPINGNRKLRIRGQFTQWLDLPIVAASFYRDPQIVNEAGPKPESIFCANGKEASTFTLGELKDALGDQTAIRIGK